MPWNNSRLAAPEPSRRTPYGRSGKPWAAIIVLGAFLAALLANAAVGRVVGSAAAGVIAVPALLAAVCAVGAALWAAKKRRTGGREMHADHERRTRGQRPRGSADPCAYSEHHSWQKSQSYDDPWDF